MISSNVVLTTEHLERVRDTLLQRDAFVFDVETSGDNRGVPQVNKITWLSLASDALAVVVPMGHPNGNVMLRPPTRKKNAEGKYDMTPAVWDEPPTQLRPSQVFRILEPLFMSPDIVKVAHNATFDLGSVAKYFGGRIPPAPYADTIVMAWLVNENRRLGLKDLTLQEYRRRYDTENVGRRVETHPFNKVARYAYLDGKYTWLHYRNLLQDVKTEDVESVLELEMEVMAVLLDMGAEGTPVNEERMHELDAELSEKVVEIEGRLYRAAGKKFNLNSPKQKVDLLYGPVAEGGQGLKPWRLTKGGMVKDKAGKPLSKYDYSTDAEALERYHSNKVVAPLLEYQEVQRVLGTYVQGYIGVSGDPKKPGSIFDGKVYPDFVQYGTVSGRFSCRAPNLQNIPRPDTELGRSIRSLFIAGPGHKLIVADYGQIELVVLAHYLGRGALYDGFFNGIDPHTMTAAIIFGVKPDAVTKAQRQAAKAINFAVVYGAGADKVASMAKTSVSQAKGFLEKHQRAFPEIYKFKDQVVTTCRERSNPHIKTLLGRKRRLPTIWAKDFGTRSKAERQAVNSLIQGSSADIIKMAMVQANEALKTGDTGKILLTVHDELVVRAEEGNATEASRLLREAMVGPEVQKWVDVPLSIDLHIVDNWAEAK